MLKRIAIALVVAVAVVLIYAATRPDSFRVERTISIKAVPEKVFPLVNDFHNWTQWSPWENIDPNLKRSYYQSASGATSGKGSAYAWEGNNKVGQGRMEITDASAPSKIIIKLDFLKPFEAHNTAEFTLAANGDSTDVTWAMYGPSPYMTKVMGVFFSMDKMVGAQFETGLANLKAIAEKAIAEK
jgi:carbon monoxide dehydrogenase subunit G